MEGIRIATAGGDLAGGDGTRLLALTRGISGDDRPRQLCSMLGNETLLLRAGGLGWCDLGDPGRVRSDLERATKRPNKMPGFIGVHIS
jgi:hypothetical protein